LRINENFERMLADHFCWCAVTVDRDAAQAVITVSTVLYVGRRAEIGDLYVLPEHRSQRLARRLVELPGLGTVRKAVRRSLSPSRRSGSSGISSLNSTGWSKLAARAHSATYNSDRHLHCVMTGSKAVRFKPSKCFQVCASKRDQASKQCNKLIGQLANCCRRSMQIGRHGKPGVNRAIRGPS
jgi:hypothetical protein